MFHKHLIWISTLALLGCASGQETPESITNAVRVNGASVIVKRLHASATWDTVLDRVEAGDAKWIAVMPVLAPGTDGPTRHDVQVALAFGLQHNAEQVLQVLGQTKSDPLSVQVVCDRPFDGSDKPSSIEDYQAAVTDAVSKVQPLDDVRLKMLRDDCLTALERPKG